MSEIDRITLNEVEYLLATSNIEIYADGETLVINTDYTPPEPTPPSGSWESIIGTDPNNYHTHGAVTYSNSIFTMSGDNSWDPYIYANPLQYKYSDLVDKRIRVSADYIITGLTSGDFRASPSLYTQSVNTASSTRVNWPSSSSPLQELVIVDTNGSGTLTYEFVLSADVLWTNAITTSNYVGLSMYFNANSGSQVKLSNIKMEAWIETS